MQTFNSLERRRRRAGAAEVKEDGVETEDGAGNPTGNTSIPHNTGVGVSTRRTTYVMVSEGKTITLISMGQHCSLVLHLLNLTYSPFSHRKRHVLKRRRRHPTCLPQLLHLNLRDLLNLDPKVGSLATGRAHHSGPGGSVKPLPNRQQQLLRLPRWRQHHHQLSRGLLWMRRELRASMGPNTATEIAV